MIIVHNIGIGGVITIVGAIIVVHNSNHYQPHLHFIMMIMVMIMMIIIMIMMIMMMIMIIMIMISELRRRSSRRQPFSVSLLLSLAGGR